MRKRVVRLAPYAGLLIVFAAGCVRAPSESPPARHLVLVTIDTLRADHVGVYGNPDVATPHLDGIARAGAMAPEATSHVPLTRPSHVSLFTGRLPPGTGIRDNISPAVVPAVPLLAPVLKQAGFATAAFVSSVVLASQSGLDRGFDVYSDEFEGGAGEAQFLNTVQKRGDVTTVEAIAWLEKTRRGPAAPARLFLWLHLYDPHDPYEPPEPYASRYAGRLYDGEVAWSDELVGRLDDTLARLGLAKDALLVVTSDHGEGLGDHGEALHGFFVYQSTLRVPFLVRGPGVVPGTRLGTTVRLVDVFPTVLDLLRVPAPVGTRFDGRSLAPALRGEKDTADPVTYAESLVPLLHFGWSDLRVLREGRFKYIQAPRPELYDLTQDPHEQSDLLAAQASRAQAMRSALGRILEAERATAASAGAAPAVPPELLEKLGALGYVGGAAPAQTSTPGADPKDKVEDFRIANDLIREGLLRYHDKDYRESVKRFREVLNRGIESFEVHFYLARGLAALGNHKEAAAHFEAATRRAPAHAEAWEGLAGSRSASGDSQAALAALKQGQKSLPQDAGLVAYEGRLLRDLGRRDEARVAYEAAIAKAPRSGRLRAALGELLRDMGAVEDAIRRQREAVELEPQHATYWNSLGMTLGGTGRLAEAEAAFREAVQRDGSNHRYAYNLGFLLLREGRPAEAREWLLKSLAADPSFVPARERLAELSRARK
jgi:arylsulfatase A-like enzyme/Flp pilus assembly protein TadD